MCVSGQPHARLACLVEKHTAVLALLTTPMVDLHHTSAALPAVGPTDLQAEIPAGAPDTAQADEP